MKKFSNTRKGQMCMDDKTLALLGDKAAQERLTERGELIPCVKCGNEVKVNSGIERTGIFKKEKMFWITCEKCGSGSTKANTLYETISSWNSRAPILTPEQIKRLEGVE